MNLHCTECGHPNVLPLSACVACGFLRAPAVLELRGSASDKPLSIRTAMTLGLRALKQLVGEDARFLSEPQFAIGKSAGGGWTIAAISDVKNPTIFNGSPLSTVAVEITEGGVISLPKEKCRIEVSFRWDG